MTTLIFDVEATGTQTNHAHPFDPRNRACNIGFKDLETGEKIIIKLEYDDEPYGESLRQIRGLLDRCTTLVGFNLKYDLAWLHRYGFRVSDLQCRFFDCQLAWYILRHQKFTYPSLNQVAEDYGCDVKLDVVKEEYWDMGIDTDQVPYEILCEYLAQDLETTAQVYNKIIEEMGGVSPKMQKLISVSMQDLVVLFEIEANGFNCDVDKCQRREQEINEEIEEIDKKLKVVFGYDWLNFNSGDHLSAVLYGGVIKRTEKQDYVFTYKDGRTAIKQRNTEVPYTFKGMYKPLEGSQLAKEGFYSTDEGTLIKVQEKAPRQLKQIIDLLLYRAKLEKLVGTYYKGFPKRIGIMGWNDNIIHSNFNQCVAQSGRLSSTKPNLQNLADKVKDILITRFKK